eukprot:gnl/TRDRNA2_/TRDRNA2_163402_c0_seq1.p2 gnl/TRDRNA2_/TRDRNA2_163402_c0~~gnl/TRDRNA2_/TRDRNA2_163402_c0_seq1.p2  ORF type:complete len:125 (-),score=25.74 gnl/TRDRNA2_/TRDRNA2_163402_c0_seq1:154-528(-)
MSVSAAKDKSALTGTAGKAVRPENNLAYEVEAIRKVAVPCFAAVHKRDAQFSEKKAPTTAGYAGMVAADARAAAIRAALMAQYCPQTSLGNEWTNGVGLSADVPLNAVDGPGRIKVVAQKAITN